jgi:hypothetical protein
VTVCGGGARLRFRRSLLPIRQEIIMNQTFETVGLVTVAVVLTQVSSYATANPTVPEISPGSVSAGLGLLAAGVLMLRARRRSK